MLGSINEPLKVRPSVADLIQQIDEIHKVRPSVADLIQQIDEIHTVALYDADEKHRQEMDIIKKTHAAELMERERHHGEQYKAHETVIAQLKSQLEELKAELEEFKSHLAVLDPPSVAENIRLAQLKLLKDAK